MPPPSFIPIPEKETLDLSFRTVNYSTLIVLSIFLMSSYIYFIHLVQLWSLYVYNAMRDFIFFSSIYTFYSTSFLEIPPQFCTSYLVIQFLFNIAFTFNYILHCVHVQWKKKNSLFIFHFIHFHLFFKYLFFPFIYLPTSCSLLFFLFQNCIRSFNWNDHFHNSADLIFLT